MSITGNQPARTPLLQADAAAATASPAKLLRGEAVTDVAAAKDSHSNFTPGAAAVTPPTAASAPKSAKASKVGSGSKVQVKAVGGEALGPAAVGRAIRVYWPGEDAWFTGKVVGEVDLSASQLAVSSGSHLPPATAPGLTLRSAARLHCLPACSRSQALQKYCL